ncbi:MAG TPA: ATP-binding protein [Opitutaceae bacterium]|nr:ATP-binding protein [Opitutaceae bacterium]
MFLPFVTAVLMLGIGIGVLCLNAKRPTNQALAAICFLGVLFFAAQLAAKYLGAKYPLDHSYNPLPWVRLKFGFVGLMSPLMVWVCYYLVSGRYTSRRNLLIKLSPWVGLSLFLSFFAFSEGFIPNSSLPGNEHYGRFSLLYFGPMLIGQIAVCVSSAFVAPTLRGVRRVEFKFITIALCYLSLAAILVETVYATWPKIPGMHGLTRFLSYSVYIAFGISAWNVASRRVYQSGQVLASLLERAVLLTVIGIPTALALRFVVPREPSLVAAATIIAGAFLLLAYCDDRLRGWLKLKAEQQIQAVAAELHSKAANESDPDRLLRQFEVILTLFAKCSAVVIFQRDGKNYRAADTVLPLAVLDDAKVLSKGWASAVALARSPASKMSGTLESILRRGGLAVLVCPRWEKQAPTVIVGFGARENELPYTHPEVRLMRELAEVVEGLYTRVRLGLQARQSEQLAAIGQVGLKIAHELRNPMDALKSFSQLLPERIDDAGFLRKFSSIVPRETERIEALAEQLLDLARPRKYNLVRFDLHRILDETLVLCRAQLHDDGISIVHDFAAQNATVLVDGDSIRQVILNLVRNAAEAVASNGGSGTIELRTYSTSEGVCVEVEDSGPGIPKEVRPRLFEPFASAGKQKGVGLGLAICHEIVKVHRGAITADLNREHGCLFRVALPLAD